MCAWGAVREHVHCCSLSIPRPHLFYLLCFFFFFFCRRSPVERAGADELRERLLAELVEKEALERVSKSLGILFPLPAPPRPHLAYCVVNIGINACPNSSAYCVIARCYACFLPACRYLFLVINKIVSLISQDIRHQLAQDPEVINFCSLYNWGFAIYSWVLRFFVCFVFFRALYTRIVYRPWDRMRDWSDLIGAM